MAKHSAIPVLLVSTAMLIATPVAVAFADPLDSVMAPGPTYTELVPDRLTTSPETNLYYIQLQERINQQNRSQKALENALQAQHDAIRDVLQNCPECFR